ncbi:MAG: zinc ribbon-containing protein [Proteobacteria bacterium]|nr:zinc ribbon-containing protein [Pseudomonadota bacterium]
MKPLNVRNNLGGRIMPTTGQIVEKSGIYACTKCGNEITSVKGERFPPCAQCRGTNFRLVRATR